LLSDRRCFVFKEPRCVIRLDHGSREEVVSFTAIGFRRPQIRYVLGRFFERPGNALDVFAEFIGPRRRFIDIDWVHYPVLVARRCLQSSFGIRSGGIVSRARVTYQDRSLYRPPPEGIAQARQAEY